MQGKPAAAKAEYDDFLNRWKSPTRTSQSCAPEKRNTPNSGHPNPPSINPHSLLPFPYSLCPLPCLTPASPVSLFANRGKPWPRFRQPSQSSATLSLQKQHPIRGTLLRPATQRRGRPSRRNNAIFQVQKLLQSLWNKRRKLLPGQHLQAHTQFRLLHRGHHFEPRLAQVRPPRIVHNAEPGLLSKAPNTLRIN